MAQVINTKPKRKRIDFNKPPLTNVKNIEYAAGYRFEDHEVSGAAEFDAIQNDRDSALAELEAFDAGRDSVPTVDAKLIADAQN